MRLQLAFRVTLLSAQDAYLQHKTGLVDEMTLDNSMRNVRGGWLSQPVYRALWRTPARARSSGPGFGYRPVDEGATLTTAWTPLATRSSAAIRSRSAWSMIAMSRGAEPLDEVLGPAPQAGAADDRRPRRAGARFRARAAAPRPVRTIGAMRTRDYPRGRREARPRRPGAQAAFEQLARVTARRGVATRRRRASGRSRRPARRRRPARPSPAPPPAAARFAIRKWVVGQRRDLRQVGDADHLPARRPARRSRSPTARAVLPPIPASISSKTSVRSPRRGPSPVSASMIRDSSPPDAASRSGDVGIPGLVATSSSTVSAPLGAEAVGVRLEHHLEPRALHRQLGELGRRPARRARRGLRARRGSAPRRARARCAVGRGEPALELARRAPRRSRAARSRPGSARRGRAPPRSSRRAFASAGRARRAAPRPPRGARARPRSASR